MVIDAWSRKQKWPASLQSNDSALPDGLAPLLQLPVEPNRLRILALLTHGERCVCDIEAALDLPQNLVSHHLKVLKRSGMLHDRRAGRWVYYRLDSQVIAEQLHTLTSLLELRGAETSVPASSRISPAGVPSPCRARTASGGHIVGPLLGGPIGATLYDLIIRTTPASEEQAVICENGTA